MIRTFIYGSCVSRDTFATLAPQRYLLTNYIARQSLISATAPPRLHTLPVLQLDSQFQQRMVEGDWNQTLIPALHESATATDLLLWDLCDERLGVRTVPSLTPSRSSYITRSVDSIRSGLDASFKDDTLIRFGSDTHFSLFTSSLDDLLKTLEGLRLTQKTVLLAPRWASQTNDGTKTPTSFGLDATSANNTYGRYYDLIRDRVDIPILEAHDVLADTKHKWGLAPFHYATPVYAHLRQKLEQTVVPTIKAKSHHITSSQEALVERAAHTRYRTRNIDPKSHQITRHISEAAFHASKTISPGIHVVSSGEIPIDLLYVPKEGSRTTVVLLHGAMEQNVRLPVLTGTGVSRGMDAHRLFISDPSLLLSESLLLSWYAGNYKQPTLQQTLAALIQSVIKKNASERVILFGGSGAGFASLQLAPNLPNSTVVIWNPQTDLRRYGSNSVRSFTQHAFKIDPHEYDPLSIIPSNVQTEVCSPYRSSTDTNIVYMQNLRDPYHVNRHLAPFLNQLHHDTKFHLLLEAWNPGHTPPPKTLLREVLDTVVADGTQALSRLNFVSGKRDALRKLSNYTDAGLLNPHHSAQGR